MEQHSDVCFYLKCSTLDFGLRMVPVDYVKFIPVDINILMLQVF